MTLPGLIMYVPHCLRDEVEDLKAEKKIKKNSEAMRAIVKYSQIGREAERIIKLDFRWRPKNVLDEKQRRHPVWRL